MELRHAAELIVRLIGFPKAVMRCGCLSLEAGCGRTG
jgi:hypothetical protein